MVSACQSETTGRLCAPPVQQVEHTLLMRLVTPATAVESLVARVARPNQRLRWVYDLRQAFTRRSGSVSRQLAESVTSSSRRVLSMVRASA